MALMIVRVQSKNGTKRITTHPRHLLRDLLEKVTREFQLDEAQSFSVFRSPGYRDELSLSELELPLHAIHIRHGDMLYLLETSGRGLQTKETTADVPEDEIDQLLKNKDGLIQRDRDPQLCRHGFQGKCLNCAPLEPWDPKYLQSRDPPIKHLSFHCYLRKLKSGVDKGKFVYLEDLSCKIKSGCVDHAPWPAGICTKCQPSAVTLARQPYRHVDNVMFEDAGIVENFLEGWRKSGCQRVGFLIGRYEEYEEVPLGIKAVVAAIYEPPQACTQYSVELLKDNRSQHVDELAGHLGLQRVGWIFTDLESEGNGKVAHKRNMHTHWLSAEECIMAADFQNLHSNPCREAKGGSFGSKFVTVCVSGDETNQVALKGYQVSNQCMALVRDDCLVPTLDAPELGYIRESTSEQYVPDVFYTAKGEYGSEVTKLARPLPVEYLLVELTTTTPKRPKPSLPGGKGDPFTVENREHLGEIQSFDGFIRYLEQQRSTNFLCSMSDFHLLLFLYTTDVVQLQPHLPSLCSAIREQDRARAESWKRESWWSHVEQLIMAASVSPSLEKGAPDFSPMGSSGASSSSGASGVWVCSYCTLQNQPHTMVCEACSLPRS